MSQLQKRVAVIGGGPAGLMAAEVMAADAAVVVSVYDRMPSVGRRLLMAGRGGLNLTHAEDLELLLGRYGDRQGRLRAAIEALPPAAVRAWCEGLGQETFIGSSGRVFPRAMKASPLLRAWLRRLADAGVTVTTRHRWCGFGSDGALRFETPGGQVDIRADAVVLALGGASWRGLGADPAWVEALGQTGIGVAALLPANCGFVVGWSDVFRQRFEGQPLKRIELSFGGRCVRGEIMVTASGIEGGAVYALSGPLRAGIVADGAVVLSVDLRPDLGGEALAALAARPRGKQSMSSFLRKTMRLAPVGIGLLQDAVRGQGRRLGDLDAEALAGLIKAVPLRLIAPQPIERAISTAGGVLFDEVDEHFMLKQRPGVFVAGEMLDWEAPTGGYLLQASLATGAAAGRGVLEWLRADDR